MSLSLLLDFSCAQLFCSDKQFTDSKLSAANKSSLKWFRLCCSRDSEAPGLLLHTLEWSTTFNDVRKCFLPSFVERGTKSILRVHNFTFSTERNEDARSSCYISFLSSFIRVLLLWSISWSARRLRNKLKIISREILRLFQRSEDYRVPP